MDFATEKLVKTGLNRYDVQYGDDSNTHAEFEQVAVLNQKKSETAGCPQYDNVDFITIMFAGDKTKVVKKPVNEHYIARFPQQYSAYKAGLSQAPNGYDITQWPILTKAEAMDLKARGIHTVEMMANIPDSACSFFGATQYREKARTTLSKAQDGSVVLAVKAENEVLKADIDALKEQIRDLAKLNNKEKDKK